MKVPQIIALVGCGVFGAIFYNGYKINTTVVPLEQIDPIAKQFDANCDNRLSEFESDRLFRKGWDKHNDSFLSPEEATFSADFLKKFEPENYSVGRPLENFFEGFFGSEPSNIKNSRANLYSAGERILISQILTMDDKSTYGNLDPVEIIAARVWLKNCEEIYKADLS